MRGGPTNAFAAPECRRPFLQLTAARRLVGLVTATWATFEQIAAASPAELRKRLRGGGRCPEMLGPRDYLRETEWAGKDA